MPCCDLLKNKHYFEFLSVLLASLSGQCGRSSEGGFTANIINTAEMQRDLAFNRINT